MVVIHNLYTCNEPSSSTTTQHGHIPILRNAVSLPDIRSRAKKKSSPLKKEISNSKLSKKVGFFKKISIEWNLLLFKLRSILEEVFNTDELVDDLFVDVENDDTLDRLIKSNKGYNSASEAFLEGYKKYKSLDRMAAIHLKNEEVKSSTTFVSDSNHNKMSCTLQDFIQQSAGNSNVNLDMNSRSPHPDIPIELDVDSDREDGMDDESEEEGEGYLNEINFRDLDLCKLKQEFEIHAKNESPAMDSGSSRTTLHMNLQIDNIGTSLWEYRRSKWLANDDPQKVEKRLRKLSISHIPRDLYVKIYNNLVDKGRLLKNEKRINLEDLVKIINAGWIAEEKWERAARGLP